MKKVVFFGLLVIGSFGLNSCGSVNNKMQQSLNKAYPGMSISEFKRVLPDAMLLQIEANYACYEVRKSSAKFGEPGGYVYSQRFFYFRDNKLYRIDEGVKATDLKIEIQQDIYRH